MIRKKRMSKGIAKILSGLLIFGMVAGLVPAVPGGTVHAKAEGESEQNVTAVENPEHKHCVCGTGEHTNNGHDYKEETWIGINNLSEIDSRGNGNYYLKQDVNLEEVWKCRNDVKLCLNGHKITREIKSSGSFPSENAVIYIEGTFTLTDCKEKGIIQHLGENTGAGVCNIGSFFMYNGMISNNNCGVKNAGEFNMFGGTISGNTNEKTSDYGGGVCVDAQHTFNMYGGTISGNTAGYGGGVNNEGTFNMYDGSTISDNTECTLPGVFSYGGGAVYNGGTFNMKGGVISGNTSEGDGGGVFNYNGIFNMSSGEIKGNKSTAINNGGGGVYNETGEFNMSGDAIITGNTSKVHGGGVMLNGGTLTLSGTANITENKVNNNENNLYLKKGKTVSASGLASGAVIGVTTFDDPKEGSPVTITSNAASAENFKSDNSDYVIGTDANRRVVLKCKEKLPTVPNPVPNRFTYDGTEHTGIELGENYKDTNGTNKATDAGTYKVTIKPSDGKTWEDGTTTEKQLEWIIEKASQNAPTGLVGEKTITAGGSDGKITGVTEQMEYRKSGADSYTACTGTEITGLSAGTYEVRYKENNNYKESPAFTVTVPDADMPVYILEIINGTGNGTYVEGTLVTITANPAADGKVFDKWVKMYGDAVIADENSATTTVTTKIAPTTIKATYKDSETTPTPNPEPNPEPKPEPTPTPTPNPTPEATTPTPDSAPTTSTPAASTTTVPVASAPAQVTYDILDGAGSSWTQNTDGSLAIRGSGEISKFREVKVDGVTVDPVNYTVTEGSTIITFKPEYLKSLSAGNHSFELVWTDGTAATNFTVAENADQSAKSPKTGEDFSRTLCTVLLMVSCAGLAGIFVRRKKSSLR